MRLLHHLVHLVSASHPSAEVLFASSKWFRADFSRILHLGRKVVAGDRNVFHTSARSMCELLSLVPLRLKGNWYNVLLSLRSLP
jgi:hypothetical protein